MKNLMMFFGSCGHTTIREVSDEVWLRFATKPGHGPLGASPPCRSRTGRKTRMVYVYPLRYCVCQDCFEQEWPTAEGEHGEVGA